ALDRLSGASVQAEAVAPVDLVLPRLGGGRPPLRCGPDRRLGDDGGRPPALGRVPRYAHLGSRHRGGRDSRRLRHARARLPRARRRGRVGPAPTVQDAGLMHLYELPLWFALVGLALYTVLGGADFGAGFWQLFAGKGKQADEIRD